MYRYYDSLPTYKKTVMVSISQNIICSISASRTLTLIRNWISYIWTEDITYFMKANPNITCSLMAVTHFKVLTINFAFAFLCFKAYAKLDSPGFLSMNHERAGKIAALLNISLVCIELCCLFYTFGSICVDSEYSYLHVLLCNILM